MDVADLVVENPTRVLLFTGKGGVGKTTLACATAVALADGGKKVLLVSTDPASNLDEVLETDLGNQDLAVSVKDVANLEALNIDPEAAAHAYRERIIGPYRGILPPAALNSMEEQLSGACTVEIAAFDEFTKLLADPAASARFDHVIFDTAPTGHTLRLLKLPAAWTEFIATNSTGTSCLGPLAGLQAQQAMYAASVENLLDPLVTTVILVSRPDTAALAEAERTRSELGEAGIRHITLALNAMFQATAKDDPIAMALESRALAALDKMPTALGELKRIEVPTLSFAPIGATNLRRVSNPSADAVSSSVSADFDLSSISLLGSLIDELEVSGHGVVLTMGKGGVGKTTIAAAVAVALAERGHRVHLSTTDPAAHIAAAVQDAVPGLTLSRIDPHEETGKYSREVMAQSAPNLDEKGLALLEEDLRSPCTEEIAVFRAFADEVAKGQSGFVILDTAPTGHTLLLLDAAEAYHREISRNASDVPDAVRELLPRLRNSTFTKVLLVALPEATPVHEAARLQEDLRRAGIEPYGWVINQSFLLAGSTDPVLEAKAEREKIYIREVSEKYAMRVAVVPWRANEPIGPDALRELAGGTLLPA
ncbi:MAG: arsenical pump-driving ATPase [Bdellovibrionales bacterium]|nr:arsenical pump-driving ATPase [Bdellovibrionales bacterium]